MQICLKIPNSFKKKAELFRYIWNNLNAHLFLVKFLLLEMGEIFLTHLFCSYNSNRNSGSDYYYMNDLT